MRRCAMAIFERFCDLQRLDFSFVKMMNLTLSAVGLDKRRRPRGGGRSNRSANGAPQAEISDAVSALLVLAIYAVR